MNREIKEVLITDTECEGMRLDAFLSSVFSDRSRTFFQKLIREGNVKVEGKTSKPGAQLSSEMRIEIWFPEPQKLDISSENIPLDVVYEDEDVILINKPAGMVVHPAQGHYSGTLVNALLYHCRDLSGINGILRPGIVHRIDRDTTGVLIACKNDRAHNDIAAQLKVHSSRREYLALVTGNIKEDSGTVNQPIGRDPKDRKKMAVVPDGKEAVTHYRVIERFEKYTLIKCRLETGRTHQIRVHMAYLHHPLVGDPVYCSSKPPFETTGQMLHACLFGFKHPTKGVFMEFTVKPPEAFLNILKKLRK